MKIEKEKFSTIRKRNKCAYIQFETVVCLDTETSHTDDNLVGWIYHWGINIGSKVYRGRDINELMNLLTKICTVYNVNEYRRLVIYVHNLSYDICYLERHLEKYFGYKSRLDIKSRKTLTYVCENGLEFRCSYLLSGMSLDKFSKEMKVEHKKLSGAVDHYIKRYPWSKLEFNDIKYMYYDIISLSESITKKMNLDNDNIVTIPYTKTGYVRRWCRRKLQGNTKYRNAFKKTRLSLEQYLYLEDAYKGGYTHASYKYRGKVVKGRIKHYDFRSHYPTVMMFESYPIGKFIDMDVTTLEELKDLNKKFCLLVTVELEDGYLREGHYFPLLQTDLLRKRGITRKNIVNNNGRANAFRGKAEVNLTYEDLELILDMYSIRNIKIIRCQASARGEIPSYLKEGILEFLKGKTEYKGIDAYMCQHNKTLLNSLYGMLCTKMIRDNIEYDEDGIPHAIKLEREEMEEALDKYYNSRNNFNMFQLGVWVTAYARKWLYHFFKIIGEENVIYCDTDSAFFISNGDIETAIEKENDKLYKTAINKTAFIKHKGKIVNLGAFVDEEDNIKAFKCLHAKCYVVIDKYDVMKCTIAGVVKKGRNGNTIENELGSIDNLKHEFTFTDCGGTTAIYNGRSDIGVYSIGDYKIEYGNSCIIKDCEKTLRELDEKELVLWLGE